MFGNIFFYLFHLATPYSSSSGWGVPMNTHTAPCISVIEFTYPLPACVLHQPVSPWLCLFSCFRCCISSIYSKIYRWVIKLYLGLHVVNQFHLSWILILETGPHFWLLISLHPAVLSTLCWHLYAPSRCKVQAFRSQAAKNILSYLMVALLGRQLFSLISITMCAQQSEWKKEKYGTLILAIRNETPQLLQQSQRWKPSSMMKMPKRTRKRQHVKTIYKMLKIYHQR